LEKLRTEFPKVSIDVDLDTNTIRLRGRAENIAEVKTKILEHNCKKEKIVISKRDIGLVVGKGGSTLNKLETEHNVSIHVDSSDNAKDVGSVEVVGLAADVEATCDYLNRLLYENEDIEEFILCTPGQKNMFIDNSGAILKEIQSVVNGLGGHSLIVFEKRDEESINTKAMVKLTIKSTRSMLPTVKRLVQERIDTYESTVVTIDVDPSIVPAIIGKGGETIKALEKTGVGATLEVEKGSSKVSVQSIDSATRLAVLEKIKEIVENNQTERLPINKNIIGQLLGEPGKDIRKAITDEIGAWMSLDDDESCIIIRGNKDKV
jgi:polyribonucleotide nucleotidyltransferase